MSRKAIHSSTVISIVLFSMIMISCSKDEGEVFSENVKISLRNVGHQLLLTNQDSTSLVLPVVALERFNYELSFEQQLSFDPSNLVSIVDSSFQKSKLPKYYRVEVVQCSDHEIAYSYEISAEEKSTIIPCRGRILPEGCYTIEVRFTNKKASFYSENMLLLLLLLCGLGFLAFWYFKRREEPPIKAFKVKYTAVGSFQFYPEQNKLVKEAVEISLSKKECELLEIFVAHPNQVIRRNELTKKVWEDNGVFVGRSLDTYISKLRKKLKDDDRIKLTNVHGIGYKLEIVL